MRESVKIGNVTIDSRLALAPMAGVTDLAFRTICRELGAGYTVTEMVSAKALCYQDQKSLPLLKLGEGCLLYTSRTFSISGNTVFCPMSTPNSTSQSFIRNCPSSSP